MSRPLAGHGILLIIMLAATVAVAGCQGLTRATSQPATPTAIMLPAVAPTATMTVTVSLPRTNGPTPAATAGATRGASPTPPPQPSVTSVRVMAVGTSPAITLRAAPDNASPTLATLPGSTVFWAEGRSEDGRWLSVTYGNAGAGGWVETASVRLFGNAATLPAGSAQRAAQATPQVTSVAPEGALNGRIESDQPLNVRAGPGVDQTVLGRLNPGDAVAVVGRSDSGEWLQIVQEQGRGWVAARFVSVDGDANGLPVTAQATSGVPSAAAAAASGGKIVFQSSSGGEIYMVNADGSGLRKVANGMDPVLSPDGTRLAYAHWGANAEGVFVIDLQSGQERQVAPARQPRSPTWSADGTRLVFAYLIKTSACYATPFGCLDEQRVREALGGKECIDTRFGRYCLSDFQLRSQEETGLAQVNVADGAWLDLSVQRPVQAPQWNPRTEQIMYKGPHGLQITAPNADTRSLVEDVQISAPAWSPDGQRIAVQKHVHDHTDIFLLNPAGQVVAQLTAREPLSDKAANNVSPTWSPDGRRILFLSDRDGAWRFYQMNADGSDQALFLPAALGQITLRYDYAAERVASWGR